MAGDNVPLTLCRMTIEESGGKSPGRLAAAVHAQLQDQGLVEGAVPVTSIAWALDIVEVRFEPLTNLEGALITTPERSSGSILVNGSSGDRRRRFTIAHELGHYLNLSHSPDADRFACTKQDLRLARLPFRRTPTRHEVQEREANAFAAELLMPAYRLRPLLHRDPTIEDILKLVDTLECSRETVARRYVELHAEQVAVVFGRHGRCLYTVRSRTCPALTLVNGSSLPDLPDAPDRTRVTAVEDADPSDWVRSGHTPAGITVQTLYQQDGFTITLLHLGEEDEDEADLEDSHERFARFNRR